MADWFVSSVLQQWESNDRSRLVLAVNDVLPPDAEWSVWVWEGLHWSDDHARFLGLLHQNPGGGQQQESWCENQLWKIKTRAVSGPGPLQRVDLTTCRPRYWNGNHLYSSTSGPEITPAFEPAFVALGLLGRGWNPFSVQRLYLGS